MEYTYKARVVGHRVINDDVVHSEVQFVESRYNCITTIISVPMKFPLMSEVFINISDSEPEGGAAS